MMLAADTCMLLISYCKQMMIDFRVLDRAQVLEIMIQGFLDYRDLHYRNFTTPGSKKYFIYSGNS